MRGTLWLCLWLELAAWRGRRRRRRGRPVPAVVAPPRCHCTVCRPEIAA
jgi:hypothetical protein